MEHDVKKEEIYKLLSKMSGLFDKPPTQERLAGYVAFLAPYPMQRVRPAILEACKTCLRFPALAELITIIESKNDHHDVAVQIAGKIIKAVLSFGQYRSKSAKQEIGVVGWRSVESIGGWKTLCTVKNSELGIVRAQLRDAAKAILKTKFKDEALMIDKVQLETKTKLDHKEDYCEQRKIRD